MAMPDDVAAEVSHRISALLLASQAFVDVRIVDLQAFSGRRGAWLHEPLRGAAQDKPLRRAVPFETSVACNETAYGNKLCMCFSLCLQHPSLLPALRSSGAWDRGPRRTSLCKGALLL